VALSAFAQAVLDVVDTIPRGQVLTYGDVAELMGGRGARAVGAVLARAGPEVPWHRVVLSSGRPAPGHEAEALRRLAAEGVPLLEGRVDLSRARWDGR
jgi:alkylated DNA nucleotide flippase Atl1